MVWQMALSMQPKHIENSTTHNAANDCMVFGKPKSILTLNNNIKYTDQQESVFFIHDIYSTEVHYSGTFVNELPAVSIKKHRIIILNGTNLKLVDMGSKQTVFSTTVARDLVHVGFTLGQFWIAQHPSGGFYTINLDDTSKFGWIPAKDASGEARASTNALVKVAGNNTAIWIMNKIV
ncbi:hypothetical protein BDF19DRAFT_419080 [Syncephalis fuscata]|nr:hypothetical protein BDF19DRAFT_419080 [Syncephalis fuscata]